MDDIGTAAGRADLIAPVRPCMAAADRAVATLRARGELWQARPGLVGMRGDLLALYRGVERAIAELVAAETRDEWLVPQGIALETLARAGYFESLPQWLTLASHLSDDPDQLRLVADDADPADAARTTAMPAEAALAPAACYHAYAALAGAHLSGPRVMSVHGTCWRHEGDRLEPLARGWAFTMHELVCIGGHEEVEALRRRGMLAAELLARSFGLEPSIVDADVFPSKSATDRVPFPRSQSLKHQLLLPLGDRSPIAATSFNHHERHFGEAFDIVLPDGTPAESGCVAFGIERWVLAVLAEHGPDQPAWPAALAIATESPPHPAACS